MAFASDSKHEAFSPEPFTDNYQRAVYSSLRKLVRDHFKILRSQEPNLPEDTRQLAAHVLAMEEEILEFFRVIYKSKINAVKTRVHGDLHLDQVLFNGKDFIIVDFEGEPGVSFGEKKLKRNPLKDVAGMMRSFHYAAYSKILLNDYYRKEDIGFLEKWAEQWQHYVSKFYLNAYLNTLNLKPNREIKTLIKVYMLEKAIYEFGYELKRRPDWAVIPLKGISYLMDNYLEVGKTK